MEKPVECTISKVCMKEDQKGKLPPVLISFQHGNLRHKKASHLRCQVSLDNKSKKRVFSVTTGYNNVRYSGYEEDETKKIGRTIIAIRNRITNKIKLIEADNVLLSPFVREKKPKSKSKEKDEDKYALLHKSFGSKVVKRRVIQKERLKTDVNQLASKLVEAVANIDVDVINLEGTTPSGIPCNRRATTVEDVYKLTDFITETELGSMREEAKLVIANANNLDKQQYTLFFMEQLPAILAKDEKNFESLEVLLYIDCLMKFFRTDFKSTNLQNVCSYSQIITDKICREFTMTSATNSRLRPRHMKIKAICHMIVLSLLILNFKLDLSSIVTSAKGSIKQVCELSRALGASKVVGSKCEVALKLPLPEQKLREMKDDRKKNSKR